MLSIHISKEAQQRHVGEHTSDRDDFLDQRSLLLLVLDVQILVVVVEDLERLGREENTIRLVRQLDVLGLVLDRRSLLLVASHQLNPPIRRGRLTFFVSRKQ